MVAGAEGEDAKRRKGPKVVPWIQGKNHGAIILDRRKERTEVSSLSEMIAVRGDHLHPQRSAPRTEAPQGYWTASLYKRTNGNPAVLSIHFRRS